MPTRWLDEDQAVVDLVEQSLREAKQDEPRANSLEALDLFSFSTRPQEQDSEQQAPVPDLDEFMPGFSERYHKNNLQKGAEEIVKKFNYGDFVAAKVREVKLKKGRKFDDADFERISKLVNEAVCKHQQQF